jgi:PAS domain S-box-containing protein
MNVRADSRQRVQEKTAGLHSQIASLQEDVKRFQERTEGFKLEELVTQMATEFINVDLNQADRKIEEALGIIGEFVGADRSYIFTFSEDGTLMSNTHEWCRAGIQPQILMLQNLSTNEVPWFIRQIKAGDKVAVTSLAQVPDEARIERRIWEAENIQSLICVPMVCRGKVTGFAGLDSVLRQNKWSEQVIKVLRIASHIFANLLDQKDAEQHLRHSEETYRTLVDNLDVGVTLIDSRHRIVMANRTVCKMFNRKLEELIGKACYEQFEKRSGVCPYCPGVRAMENAAHTDVETVGVRDDGSRFPVHIRALPLFYEDGSPRGFIEVVKDLTHEKVAERAAEESRRMLQMVLDNIPVRVFWKDRDSVFIGCNRVFAKDAGLAGSEDIVGKTDCELAWKEQAGLYRQDDAEVIRTGQSKLNYEEPQTGANGELKWLRTSKVPLRDLDGQIVGVLCTYEDITAHKKIEQEREELLHVLSMKNEELESIVYISSHDLRSPLVNIQGFSRELEVSAIRLRELISQMTAGSNVCPELILLLDQDIPESLRYIHTSAAKMDMLLTALLKLSRLGQVELNITVIDMNQLIADICKSIQYQITESRAEVTIEDLPDCMGDPGQIGQVFTNLLDNAIKYLSPKRKGKIRIRGKTEGKVSIYSVEDNGIGIAAEHQSKVFEIFHRLGPTEHTKGEGIGLTAAKRILARQNGRIWLQSEPDKGATFFVELPGA